MVSTVSVAEMLGLAILIAVAVAALVHWAGIRHSAVGRATAQAGRIARWISAVLVTGVAVALLPVALDDSGWFGIVLVGVPVGGAVLAVVADLRGRRVRVATWAAAAVIVSWGVITALGLGFYFLPLGILMLAAAALSSAGRPAKPVS